VYTYKGYGKEYLPREYRQMGCTVNWLRLLRYACDNILMLNEDTVLSKNLNNEHINNNEHLPAEDGLKL
jgi:hypothetical protein